MDIGNRVNNLVDLLMIDFNGGKTIDEVKLHEHPDKDTIVDILEKLRKIIYPGYYRNKSYRVYTVKNNISMLLEDVIYNLIKQISIVLKYSPDYENAHQENISHAVENLTFVFLKRSLR